MKIALTCSSKDGLLQEYKNRFGHYAEENIPADFFAEGDSFETINAVKQALTRKGHDVIGIEADAQAGDKLAEARPELVFNIAEGLFGDFRESYIPMLCERLGLPYTGSDPLTLAICLNKARAKEVMMCYNIPTADFKLFYPNELPQRIEFDFPAIIKPVAEGSSKGIFDDSVVTDEREALEKISRNLATYRQPVLLEKFLTGEEFTVAVWGNGHNIEVLPIVSISYKELPVGAQPIYSYEAKWIWDTRDKPLDIFQCPARISQRQEEKIKVLVLSAYRIFGIRDWCRIDVRWDASGIPHILELNPLPGILPNPEDNSCFPKAARTAGYSYADMINKVVVHAAKRYGLK